MLHAVGIGSQVVASGELWSLVVLEPFAATASSHLRGYERERKADMLPMGLATDSLQQLFARTEGPWQALRNWGMKGFERSGPLKEWMARQAMGTH